MTISISIKQHGGPKSCPAPAGRLLLAPACRLHHRSAVDIMTLLLPLHMFVLPVAGSTEGNSPPGGLRVLCRGTELRMLGERRGRRRPWRGGAANSCAGLGARRWAVSRKCCPLQSRLSRVLPSGPRCAAAARVAGTASRAPHCPRPAAAAADQWGSCRRR